MCARFFCKAFGLVNVSIYYSNHSDATTAFGLTNWTIAGKAVYINVMARFYAEAEF